MVFWAVVLVVALKYVTFVMRADNQGEGGTMSLLSLALPAAGRLHNILLMVGLGGAALFFGDAMITPAISVLSAIEGLEIAIPTIGPYVVPIAAGVLIAVFAIQSRGSGAVGGLFGPVMAVWFMVLALSGIAHIIARPGVVAALNPLYAVAYIRHASGWTAFNVLGSVFLALTGGEALYADMGHFGRIAQGSMGVGTTLHQMSNPVLMPFELFPRTLHGFRDIVQLIRQPILPALGR
jgi:KUP system potassium uptake protein